jgi:lysophospholipase L1-like esterase
MTKRDYHPAPFRKMVALGESTTAGGWSSNRDRCWVSMLAAMISEFQEEPVECINAGIGANMITRRSPGYDYSGKPAADERLEKHVFAHRPDLVLVSYGLNDIRAGTPLGLFVEALDGVVTGLNTNTKALVVLLGPYYMTDFNRGPGRWDKGSLSRLHAASSAVRAVARLRDCLFVDVLAANGHTDWMVHYDGVHANDLGHRIIANRIFEVLAQNCSGLARRTKALEEAIPRWRDESMLKADYGYVRCDGKDYHRSQLADDPPRSDDAA